MFKVGDLVRPKSKILVYMADVTMHYVSPEDVCLVMGRDLGGSKWMDLWVFRIQGTAKRCSSDAFRGIHDQG